MPGIPLSIRFPAPLAAALDQCAEAREWPRSSLVDTIIRAMAAATREEILNTPVPGAATEKLNLRLSPAALAHVKALAGDRPHADFLRRAVARQFPVTPDVVVPNRPSISTAGTGRTRGSAGPNAAVMIRAVALMVGIAALVFWLYRRLGDHRAPGPHFPVDEDNAPRNSRQ